MTRGCLYSLPSSFCYLCISGVQPFESYHPARSVSSLHLALPRCRRSIVEDIRQVLLFRWAIVLWFIVTTSHYCHFLLWFSISSILCVSERLYCSYCIYIVCELGRCRLYCHLEVKHTYDSENSEAGFSKAACLVWNSPIIQYIIHCYHTKCIWAHIVVS